MKNLYSLIAILLGVTVLNAQSVLSEKQQLINKEMKGAASKMMPGNLNPNTQNYDLQYQRMDLNLDPSQYNVSGSVTSHFKTKQAMSSIYFDLSDVLTVSQVKYHGANLTFQQLPTNELKINLPASLPINTLDSLTIHYSGAPDTANNAFKTSSLNGSATLSTLSEPYGAQDWFPTKQSMDDKIDRFDIKITTPSQYSVAANGKLMSETVTGSSKLTFWRTMYPTAAYLIAISIGNFTKINDTMGNPPFPFVNYLYPSTATNTAVMTNINWTKDIMNVFETHFGAYPFRNEKYGHMEYQYYGVCMEHQTMSSMSSWGKEVIAHELAHQWFGDKITCGSWNDIWLNEGFASFGEHLANEKLIMLNNNAQFKAYLLDLKNYITSQPGGSTYVADANLTNVNAIFNGRLTYTKGGYIVRMIKWILGDDVFYQAIKDYLARPNLAYGYAKTVDLATSLQTSTGINFTEFFNDWLYGQGYPTYNITWNQTSNNQLIAFKVSQTQSHSSVSFFEMPLPIKVTGTAGQIAYFRLDNTSNNQYFYLPTTFPVASVEFNYDYQMVENNSVVSKDITLSTSEITGESNAFSVYPIPANNEINITGLQKKADFKIYSADGRLVKRGIYEPHASISISDLEKGDYIFSIENKNIKIIKK